MTSSSAPPRVSVLTTVYNGAEFLRAAIDSVLAQTFPDWELVVVDDGSNDGSIDILASYQDPRIRVTVLPKNGGRLHAIRHAFDLSRGEVTAVLDADDVAHPERLEQQVGYLDQHPDALLVGAWARLIDEQGSVIGTFHPPTSPADLHDCLGWANPIVHSSALYRAQAARAVGGYPLTMRHSHDCALWTRLAQRGTIGMVPRELCDQRVVASSMTRGARFRADVVHDALLLAREAQALLDLRGQAAVRNRDEITITRIKSALYDFQTGKPLSAAVSLASAIVQNPAVIFRSRAYRRQYLR